MVSPPVPALVKPCGVARLRKLPSSTCPRKISTPVPLVTVIVGLVLR